MRTPTPATHSETTRRALLRRTWHAPFDSLQVDYSQPELRLELTAADRVLVSGIWSFETTADGEPLLPAGAWGEVCWHSDRDVDYLELEIALSGGWMLQRQMLLARKDQFLFLADALIGDNALPESASAAIRHAFRLPLAGSVSIAPAAESRESVLASNRKRLARALPLALPEWRVEPCPGELTGEWDALVLRQAAQGRNLYAPLWLDLSSSRLRRDCTWRRLTVGENLATQPRDVAVGYRAQIGKDQWLIYRTLAAKGNRTVLGQNYSSDFVCCRFLRSGTTEDILEIE